MVSLRGEQRVRGRAQGRVHWRAWHAGLIGAVAVLILSGFFLFTQQAAPDSAGVTGATPAPGDTAETTEEYWSKRDLSKVPGQPMPGVPEQ